MVTRLGASGQPILAQLARPGDGDRPPDLCEDVGPRTLNPRVGSSILPCATKNAQLYAVSDPLFQLMRRQLYQTSCPLVHLPFTALLLRASRVAMSAHCRYPGRATDETVATETPATSRRPLSSCPEGIETIFAKKDLATFGGTAAKER